jgi:aspartyl-tRNA(Asn)/glutamyl-tRNA(Gln) amidotransferase subunit C
VVNLDKKTVHYLAQLSRIRLSDKDEESLLQDLEKIVYYFEQLQEVDTKEVLPCKYVTEELWQTPLREDTVQNTLTQKEFLKISPQSIAGLVQVPPVLKEE